MTIRFADRFIVKGLIRRCMEHTPNIKRWKEIRQSSRRVIKDRIKQKAYADYDWKNIVEQREMARFM